MVADHEIGRRAHPVPAQATSYHPRPDVAYVPIHDAPPHRWRLIWLSAAETARIRAFDHTAATLAKARRT